jgi:hypothetical protein
LGTFAALLVSKQLTRRRKKMWKRLALVALALALAFAVGACSGGGEEESTEATGAGEAPAVYEQSGGGTAKGVAASQDQAGTPVSSSVPTVGPRVIQTASLSLSVPRGRFEETVDEARSIAVRLGGFVVSSTATQGRERRLVSGSLVVRLPARSYADAMRSLAGLGRVEARDESGQDVSQEFVDLEARVRHLRAVETQLLELLDRANTVAAALAVQSQLNQVQLELEQARGRLQYLEDQVSFATISLALHERLPAAAKGDDGDWGIVEAWRTAGHGFVTVIGWMFIAAATAAPALILLALALLIGRRVVRRRIVEA